MTSSSARRSRIAPSRPVRETMGYFAGIVPLRGQRGSEPSFSGELARGASDDRRLLSPTRCPLPNWSPRSAIRPAPGHHPFFEVRFALQNHPIPDVALPTLSAKLRMRSTGTARFDLGCEITERDEALEVVWLFRAGMFSQSDLEDLDRMFQDVLSNVCGSPETRTAALTN